MSRAIVARFPSPTMPHDPLQLRGQVIADKYEILEPVGEGGFAVVYRAFHKIWERPVAIKFFHWLSDLPVEHRDELAKSFVQEGALLSELSAQTTSIVQARDVGTYTAPNGVWMPYMVLEWLEGETLEERLRRGAQNDEPALGLDYAIEVLSPVAAALDVAHGRGIVHRDVKPSNVFLVERPDGEEPVVKLLDFGVAKVQDGNPDVQTAMTRTGQQVSSFTPEYGAPEQFSRRFGATGPWTDVFALALVVSELASGKMALVGTDMAQLGFAASDEAFRPTPGRFGAAVVRQVERVMEKALAVRPEARYSRVREFWNDLLEANQSALAPIKTPMMSEAPQVSTRHYGGLLQEDVETLPPPSERGGQSGTTSAAIVGPRNTQPTVSRAALGWTLALGLVVSGGVGGLLMFLSPQDEAEVAGTSARSEEPVAATLPASCPAGMILINAGQFFMGSDDRGARDNERPAHKVSLSAYCIDETEVTVAQYRSCSDDGQCRRAAKEVDWPGVTEGDRELFSTLCNAGHDDKGEHPVNCVSWQMAAEYCEAVGARLPTESEWEYATRGPDGRVYPWGDEEPTELHLNACGLECQLWGEENDVKQRALFDARDGYVGTAPVGSFPKGSSRFGPKDVVGNVWEWVADWSGEYSAAPQENPQGPSDGEKKIIRGGAFNGSYASWLRPSFRFAQDPSAHSHAIGFRCAKSATPTK